MKMSILLGQTSLFATIYTLKKKNNAGLF